MRYRRLTAEELQALEGDFVQYLAEQGVTALDWQRWTQPDGLKVHGERVEACIDGFSEACWEKACSRITHLMRPGEREVWWFAFGDTEAFALAIPREAEPGEKKGAGEASEGVQGLEARRTFAVETRNALIFELLEQGAQPCSPEAFEAVNSLVKRRAMDASSASQAEAH
jgi:hypothetical protein